MEEKRFLKKKQRSKEDGNLEQLAHYCRELGDLYRKNGKYKEALLQYKEEEKVNESLGQAVAVAVSNRMIGEIYCDMGEFKEALKYQEKHLDIAKMENNAIEEQRALANIGRTHFCMAESTTCSRQTEYNSFLSRAKKSYIESLEVCKNLKGIGLLGQMEMRARLLMNIGLVLECQGVTTRGIEYIEKAIQIGKQHELWEELFKCYSALGMLHHRCGDHTRALRNLNLALDVAERLDGRVRNSCEILLSKAEVFFKIADFGGAKQTLLKAYKLRTPDESDRKAIERNLRLAASLCQVEETVLLTNEKDYRKLKSLYETLGDGAAAVQNFKKAIEYYLKMLKCAEEAGESGRDLCPIYVSLSQTYKDDGQYELALEYSKKELELWLDVPQEACKTSLSMAEILELRKSPYIEVAGAYMKAKEFAMQAQDWKLLAITLRCLQTFQRNSGLEDLADETQKECEEMCKIYSINSSSEEEEGTGEESQGIGDYIDLDEMTESNSDEAEVIDHKEGITNEHCQADRRRSRRRATCKGLAIRRNEKGETALHRACITGNIGLVRSLVDRGHPINVRDHCGWTPLHEACNHGYDEVVSLLIEKGAQVNDRGGTHCGGVTPIHDAASCGHLTVVKILLSAGASVLARTDKGETPLDCLMHWYRRVKNDIDLYTEKEFQSVERELRKALEKVGQETSNIRCTTTKEGNQILECDSSDSQRNVYAEKGRTVSNRANKKSKRHSNENLQPWATTKNFESMLSSSEDESNVCGSCQSSSDEDALQPISKMPSKNISLDTQSCLSKTINGIQGGDSSASEYARAIASLKNRQSLMSLSNNHDKPSTPVTSERAPHLDPDEVDVDNWLEDDLGQERPAKRTKKSEYSETNSNSCLRQESRRISISRPVLSVSDKDEHTIEEFTQVQMESIKSGSEEISTTFPVAAPITDSSHRSLDDGHSNFQLIKVEVEDTLLLVPIPSIKDPTFECLAKEVTRRYYDFKRVRLEVTLHTKDGALLSKNDPISLLSSLGEPNKTLVAKVTSLDLPPIAESYHEACSACHIDANQLVEQSLEACQVTNSLCLDEMCLKAKQLSPALRAISHRYLAIRCLSLSGNDIGDKGVKMLSECLVSMNNLLTLDLSCNNITAVGLSEFASIFSKQLGAMHNPPLQMLWELNLAHNPLSNMSGPYLIPLLNGLLSLTSLCLCDCNLSINSLAGSDDANLLCLDSIEQLDVSYNYLGAEGVAAFLRCLQPSKVKVLNLGQTLGRHHKGNNLVVQKIAREVALFLYCGEFNQLKNLTELDLSQNQVTDSDMCEVLRGLKGAIHLEKLCLECNPDLTSLTLRRLLQQGTWPNLKIDLAGCPKILDYMESDDLVAAWMDNHNSKVSWWPRTVNLSVGKHVSKDTVDKLIVMWSKTLGFDAFIEQEMFGYLKLGMKTD